MSTAVKLSYSILGLIAFLELGAVGVALAVRQAPGLEKVSTPLNSQEEERKGVSESDPEVTRLLGEFSGSTLDFSTAPELKPLPLLDANGQEPDYSKNLAPRPMTKDPVQEKLIRDAQTAHIAGDMRQAILKLEEAAKINSQDLNLLYEYASVYEEMGLYDQASDYYLKVYEQGSQEGGELYQLAASKIRDGFLEKKESLVLGRVRVFKDSRVQTGEKTILSVPIKSSPGEVIEQRLLSVEVQLFDKLHGDVVRASSANEPSNEWISKPVNWNNGSEEILQIKYFIPGVQTDTYSNEGKRSYHGYLIDLYYDGELVDQQAYPRTLSHFGRLVPEPMWDQIPQESYNPENPLLPPLE